MRRLPHFALMLHLHLNLYNAHGDAVDDEGADYVDLAEARLAAITGIRSLLSAEVLQGEINLVGHLDIVDDAGAVLESVPFSDALSVVAPRE